MMSAAQDYLTGIVLKDQSNLNWSATASYYGMVHTGRLLCFVLVGSFPKNHAKLIRLLKPNGSVPLDWLPTFVGDLSARPEYEEDVRSSASRRDILDKLEKWDSEILPSLDTFARMLEKAKDLRNNSNYEALLIAHEKKHVIVTDCFTRLAECAQAAARDSLELAVKIYRLYMEKSSLLNNKRDVFKLLSNDYVKGRMYMGIKEKLHSSRPASDALRRLSKTLMFSLSTESRDETSSDEIEDFISIHKFGGKTILMENFRGKVENLCECCGVKSRFFE
jgi:hypothetical protein